MQQRYQETAYSVMRAVVGFLFVCHGAQKLFGVLGARGRVHGPLMLTAGVIETVAGSLLILGLFSSFAAFVACGEMAVAYLTQHAPHGFWPIENRGELAVLFCFIFLYIASRGDGTWSVAGLVRLAKRKRMANADPVPATTREATVRRGGHG